MKKGIKNEWKIELLSADFTKIVSIINRRQQLILARSDTGKKVEKQVK